MQRPEELFDPNDPTHYPFYDYSMSDLPQTGHIDRHESFPSQERFTHDSFGMDTSPQSLYEPHYSFSNQYSPPYMPQLGAEPYAYATPPVNPLESHHTFHPMMYENHIPFTSPPSSLDMQANVYQYFQNPTTDGDNLKIDSHEGSGSLPCEDYDSAPEDLGFARPPPLREEEKRYKEEYDQMFNDRISAWKESNPPGSTSKTDDGEGKKPSRDNEKIRLKIKRSVVRYLAVKYYLTSEAMTNISRGKPAAGSDGETTVIAGPSSREQQVKGLDEHEVREIFTRENDRLARKKAKRHNLSGEERPASHEWNQEWGAYDHSTASTQTLLDQLRQMKGDSGARQYSHTRN